MLKNESRNDKFGYSRVDDGLKQRKLKNEKRWRFDPKQSYDEDDEDEEFEQSYGNQCSKVQEPDDGG